MNEGKPNDSAEEMFLTVTPETAIIDVISRYRETEPVFKNLEGETGTCVCCEGLFLSLQDASEQFGFDLEKLLRSLYNVIGSGAR